MKPKIDDKLIYKDFLKDIPVKEMAVKYNLSCEAVRQRLRKSDNDKVIRKLRNNSISKEQIAQEYMNGKTLPFLIEEYEKDESYISHCINAYTDLNFRKKLFKEQIHYENKSDIEKEYFDKKIDIIFDYNIGIDEFPTTAGKLYALENEYIKYKGVFEL